MSQHDVEHVIGRAATDTAFREALIKNAREACKGFDLTEEELDALEKLIARACLPSPARWISASRRPAGWVSCRRLPTIKGSSTTDDRRPTEDHCSSSAVGRRSSCGAYQRAWTSAQSISSPSRRPSGASKVSLRISICCTSVSLVVSGSS